MYNMSFVDVNTTITDWTYGVNAASDGLFTSMFLLVLIVLMYILMSKVTDNTTSLLISSFITAVAGMFFLGLHMLAASVEISIILLFVASLVIKIWPKD